MSSSLKLVRHLSEQIHVYTVNVNKQSNLLTNYQAILDDFEKNKADSFKFDKDKNCFIVSHVLLRTLLGKYLSISPKLIKYKYNRYGKPSLINPPTNLQFNLSHSKGTILIGITMDTPLGVDIEHMEFKKDLDEIAKYSFAHAEYQQLQELPNNLKLSGFYNCWTRKEAVIKAIGYGLSYPLKDFVVNLKPNESAKLIFLKNNNKEWHIHGYIYDNNYCSAIAWQGLNKQIILIDT